MEWFGWVVIAGAILWSLYVFGALVRASWRGEISDEEWRRAWEHGGIDQDVYDGSYGTRDGKVWCDWCHRYHDA